jgi:hypothetical protein
MMFDCLAAAGIIVMHSTDFQRPIIACFHVQQMSFEQFCRFSTAARRPDSSSPFFTESVDFETQDSQNSVIPMTVAEQGIFQDVLGTEAP